MQSRNNIDKETFSLLFNEKFANVFFCPFVNSFGKLWNSLSALIEPNSIECKDIYWNNNETNKAYKDGNNCKA